MKIDIDALKKTLGVEVIVTSATKAEGIEKLQEAIDKNLFRKGNPTPQLQKLLQEAGMEFSKDGLATAENIFNPSISELQEKIYSLRRSHVDKIFEKAVRFDTKKLEIKNRISEILVNPITGIPILAATLYIMYYFMGVLVAQRVVDFTMNKVMGEYYLGFVKGLLTPFVKNIYIQKNF